MSANTFSSFTRVWSDSGASGAILSANTGVGIVEPIMTRAEPSKSGMYNLDIINYLIGFDVTYRREISTTDFIIIIIPKPGYVDSKATTIPLIPVKMAIIIVLLLYHFFIDTIYLLNYLATFYYYIIFILFSQLKCG